MDAFFAAIEQRDRPEWRGRPVVVGGDRGGRGVVSAASYEARRFGVHSAMPIAQARRLCPPAVFVPVDVPRYREVSRRFLAILRRWTPIIEPLSLDEAFLDLGPGGDGPQAATALKRAIVSELSLTASVGVACNKFLAKLASDLEKPDGLVVIPGDRGREFIASLPVRKVWGIGPRGEAYLHDRGIYRIGDLARVDPDILRPGFGRRSLEIVQLARGIDHRPVEPAQPARSLSEEVTFAADTRDRDALLAVVEQFARSLEERLRESGLKARTVTVKLRLADFTTLTRSRTSAVPILSAAQIAGLGQDLVGQVALGGRRVRLVGLRVSGLVSQGAPEQLTFSFDPALAGDERGIPTMHAEYKRKMQSLPFLWQGRSGR